VPADKMVDAIRRAAQRELKLSMKPGRDTQICGPFVDVKVEGLYLGWCSPKKAEELQKLYDDTPSHLRHGPEAKPVDLAGICADLEVALGRARCIEANMLVAAPNPSDVCDLRSRLEGLHARILLSKQEQEQAPYEV
jgi:hypothetical protein